MKQIIDPLHQGKERQLFQGIAAVMKTWQIGSVDMKELAEGRQGHVPMKLGIAHSARNEQNFWGPR